MGLGVPTVTPRQARVIALVALAVWVLFVVEVMVRAEMGEKAT